MVKLSEKFCGSLKTPQNFSQEKRKKLSELVSESSQSHSALGLTIVLDWDRTQEKKVQVPDRAPDELKLSSCPNGRQT